LGSELEFNEFVDQVIENVEKALSRLEGNLKITPGKELKEKEETGEKPFPSVKYSQSSTSNKKKIVQREIKQQSVSYKYEEKVTKKPPTKEKRIVIRETENNLERKEKAVSIHEIPLVKKIPSQEKYEEENKINAITETNELTKNSSQEEKRGGEEEFLDILKNVKMIHIFGPPATGKTTLAIQASLEVSPRETFYFITSHMPSIIKRIKQIAEDEKWVEKWDFKQHFYPISIHQFEEIEEQLRKIRKINDKKIGLIIIDHLTDYLRGDIHKEEIRVKLRRILEELYILAEDKNCKIFILNGSSYQGAAPAEDIVESFCDMSIKLTKDTYSSILNTEEKEIKLDFDNSGIKNLFINIFY